MIKRKNNHYYIGYMICMSDQNIYGDGVFDADSIPEIERYLKEIKIFNSGNGLSFNKIVIVSCIPVEKEFTND